MNQHPAPPDPHEGRLARIAHHIAQENLRPKLPRGVRLAMTIGPFIGFGLILFVAWAVYGRGTAAWLFGAEVGSFIGFGKFVIFGEMIRSVIASLVGYVPRSAMPNPWVLAAVVVYGDLGTALVMMANMTVLYRAPFLGRRLAACHEAGWQVLRTHRWMRRMAWLGVAVFIAAPFQGTGSVVGTILARLLGMSRLQTMSSVAAGSVAGCFGLAVLGAYGRRRIEHIANHPVAAIVFLVITVVVLVLIGRWFLGQTREQGGQGPAEQRPNH